LTIGDQNEYDNGQRLFYLGVREQMGWPWPSEDIEMADGGV
jgi:hypothetical protein